MTLFSLQQIRKDTLTAPFTYTKINTMNTRKHKTPMKGKMPQPKKPSKNWLEVIKDIQPLFSVFKDIVIIVIQFFS